MLEYDNTAVNLQSFAYGIVSFCPMHDPYHILSTMIFEKLMEAIYLEEDAYEQIS